MAVPIAGRRARRGALRRPRRPRTRRQPRAGRSLGGGRVHQRDAPLAVFRRVGRFRRAPRLHARRRHPPRGLAAVRADRSLLHEGVRGRLERELRRAARRVEVDGVRQPRHHQARLRPDARRLPDLSRAPAARPRRLRRRSTTTSSITCRRRRSTWSRAARPRSRCSRRSRGSSVRRCRSWRSTSGAAACSSSISDLYEDPQAVHRRRLAASLPRQRSDRVPRARPGGDRVSATTMRRRSRISRAASRFPSCRRRWRSSIASSSGRTSRRCASKFCRAADRLRAAQHGERARSRALQLPVHA